MSLAKSSMGIAERYLELVDDGEPRRICASLRTEHDRACAAVLEIVEAGELPTGTPCSSSRSGYGTHTSIR